MICTTAQSRKYTVRLSEQEQREVRSLLKKGVSTARTYTRARILLAAHTGKLDKEICASLGIVRSVVHDIRKHYAEGGLTRALYDAPRPGQERKLTDFQEAEVIAITCTSAPKGYARWTLDLLTEQVKTTLGVAIGRTAVWKVLLRNNTKPWLKKMWCIPKVTPEFKRKMLDVLEVYERPYDALFPVVCIDEKSKQLLKDTRTPLVRKPGKPQRSDYEYERNGTCNLFVAVEPKGEKRVVRVTKRRTKRDDASFVKYLVTRRYKRQKKLFWLRTI